jgi:aldehyde:ferredoxin oxidoreductase
VTEVAFMFSGNVLTVHLDQGRLEESFLSEDLVSDRVGGALLGLEFYKRNAEGDPIVISAGPLTGGLVPTASSVVITARSPLTGGVVHCSVTNHAGAEVKFAGYDVIVLRGRSPRPVYLWVHDEQAELVDAADLWGEGSTKITDAIRNRQGDERVQVVAAGPACTKGSLASSLSINHWASTDRAAVGALWGSKNLLAVAARGMGELEPAEIDGFGPAVLRMMACMKGYRPPEGFKWDGGHLDGARGSIAPLVHRYRGCYFCASRGRAYLMLDEEPGRMEPTEVHDPGVLIVDMLPLGDLHAAGLDGKGIGEVTRATYQRGLDPVRAARAIRMAGAADPASATRVLDDLVEGRGAPSPGEAMMAWDLGDGTGCHEAFARLAVFTTANPPLVPADCVDELEHLLVLQALAYILGLCPAGSVGAGIDAPCIEEVVRVSTGQGLSASELEGLARRLVRETLALQPSPGTEGGPIADELRGRFA